MLPGMEGTVYFLIKCYVQQVPSPSPTAFTTPPRPRKDPDTRGPGVGWSVCGASSGWDAAGKIEIGYQKNFFKIQLLNHEVCYWT